MCTEKNRKQEMRNVDRCCFGGEPNRDS
uniref:Uncharacterized protein n=1 Tax=Anguilla anguilla TaxID=7936 RepID=A0A0E9VSG0_ANGAN